MDTTETDGEIKVSAHVLVQLGEELVTDVEQAILECVKNAYDADSKGCSIKIDTQRTGKLVQRGTLAKLGRYTEATENVVVTLRDENGDVLKLPPRKPQNGEPEDRIYRHLEWVGGSVVVEDHGDGLTYEQLQGSWLVISGSGETNLQWQEGQDEALRAYASRRQRSGPPWLYEARRYSSNSECSESNSTQSVPRPSAGPTATSWSVTRFQYYSVSKPTQRSSRVLASQR